MNKKIAIVILITVTVSAFFYFLRTRSQTQKKANTTQNITINILPAKQNVQIILTFDANSSVKGEIQAENALESLLEFTKARNINVKTRKYDFGIMVESVGEKENSATSGWVYLINGKMGNESADKAKLASGDVIEWKHEKFK